MMSFDERFDFTIVVGAPDISLLGDTPPPPEVCATLITLDHHASGRPFGDIAVRWDAGAAAVGVCSTHIGSAEREELADHGGGTPVPLYVSLIELASVRREHQRRGAARRVRAGPQPGFVPATIAASLEEQPS